MSKKVIRTFALVKHSNTSLTFFLTQFMLLLFIFWCVRREAEQLVYEHMNHNAYKVYPNGEE